MEVSVVIPAYNAERFVTNAVQSAGEQQAVLEILLVEDGSTDGTLGKCQALQSACSKVVLLRHPNGANLGSAESRNLGIRHARCEYIAFLDADDQYADNRFEIDAQVFASHPEADGVYGATQAVFLSKKAEKAFRESPMIRFTSITHPVPYEELIYVLVGASAKARGHIHLNALTLKRQAIAKAGLLNPELRLGQDTEWLFRLALKCKLAPGSLSRAIATYQIHDTNRFLNTKAVLRNRHRLWSITQEWMSKNDAPPQIVEISRKHALSWKTHQGKPLDALRFVTSLPHKHPELLDNPDYLYRITTGLFGKGIMNSLTWRILHSLRPNKR